METGKVRETCNCTLGYRGYDCTIDIPPSANPCAKTRCQNGGICQAANKDLRSKLQQKSFKTNAKNKRIAFQKPFYQRRPPAPKSTKRYHAKCVCPKHYAGLLCEKQNLCLDRCLNGGTCEWSKEDVVTCNCKEGFMGERCERSTHEVDLKHHQDAYDHRYHPSFELEENGGDAIDDENEVKVG